MPAPARQACTGPYFSSTEMKAAAQRKHVVMNSANAAPAASEVSRTVVPVDALMLSMMR
jgi:hypothetical protein